MTFPQVRIYLTRNLARREMEAAQIEKVMDVSKATFPNTSSKETTPMSNSDLPSFGLGLRKKKKKPEAE